MTECEYADKDYLVLMVTPENRKAELDSVVMLLGKNTMPYEKKTVPLTREAEQFLSIREAYFSEGEVLSVLEAEGRICRMPVATCPPAIPVLVPGERVTTEAVKEFLYYGIETIDVIKEEFIYGKGDI